MDTERSRTEGGTGKLSHLLRLKLKSVHEFMRTEPKSWGNSMSRHPWSQFLVGLNITGFCQVQWKFIISFLKTGVLLIPNWLIWFSSLRPSYCSEAEEETISLWEFTWRQSNSWTVQTHNDLENERPNHSHVINSLLLCCVTQPMADAHLSLG